MKTTTHCIAMNILAHVITSIGQHEWETRLLPAHRALVRNCCADAARLSVSALATPRNRDLQLDLLRERAAIHARLASTRVLGGEIAEAFWDGFQNAVNGVVAVAFAAL